jgi:hypothetical protein
MTGKIQPCDYVINLSRTKTKQLLFIEKFNEGKELRNLDRIKPNVQNTLFRLTYLLAIHYAKPQFNFFLRKENSQGFLNLADLSLSHAKSYICNHKQDRKENEAFGIISLSTLENHLKKLEGWGLIKRVRDTQRNHILLHPQLVEFTSKFDHLNDHYNQFIKYSLDSLLNENRAIQEEKKQILTPKYPNLETLNSKTVQAVENLKGISQSDSETKSGIDNCDLETSDLDTPKAKEIENCNEKKKEKNCAKKEKSQRDQFIISTIASLWSWIMSNLYQNYEYVSESQRQVFEQYCYDYFDHSGKTNLAVASDIKARLYSWKGWIDRDKRRFTPLPSGFFVKGDLEKFDKTHHWLRSTEARTFEKKDRAKYKKQVRAFKNIHENKELSFSEKIRQQKVLDNQMNLVRKRNPKVYKLFREEISLYLTGTETNTYQ